jgi:colicin import membrane protein
MRGDFDKDLQDIQGEKEANETEKANLITATAEKMKANKDKIIADEKAAADKVAADAKAKEDKRAALHEGLDAKNLKSKAGFNKQQDESNKKAKDALDKKAAQESAGLNLTGSSEDLLKGFAAREGSALIPDKPAATQQANTAVAAAVSDADKKKQEAEAKAKTDAEAKAKADAEAKTKEEQNKKSQESPSTLLAELNTKMEQLIKHAAVTQSNTYETFNATKGLNKNLYKA